MSQAHEPDAGIQYLHAAWTAAFERRDIEAILSLLTPDYELWPAGFAPVTRDSLRTRLQVTLEAWDITSTFNRHEQLISGDLAFERGWDVQTVTARGGGESRVQRQRVFLLLRRAPDGTWRFQRGMTSPGPDE